MIDIDSLVVHCIEPATPLQISAQNCCINHLIYTAPPLLVVIEILD